MSTPAESAARPDGFVGLNIGCGSNALAGSDVADVALSSATHAWSGKAP